MFKPIFNTFSFGIFILTRHETKNKQLEKVAVLKEFCENLSF